MVQTMVQIQNILCPACQKSNFYGAHYCVYCGHSLVLNDDKPSDNLRYYITRVIKAGGQGSVYEGIDQRGRIYAIKEMRDTFVDPKEQVEATRRFNAEAAILKRLNHPRIPRVYSHFTDEGRHYLTMDFVRGDDLEHIIEQRKIIDEPQVLEWAMQICDVLDHLHTEGLVYRDIKPSNIMIEHRDGGVKLVDFGIAKILKATERGTQIGTPGYAPPEQYQGLATPASDIYALGATLHHLITGRDPTDQQPFSFPPPRSLNSSISRRTSAALERALSMKAEDRFASVADFRAALQPPVPTRRQAHVAAPPPGSRQSPPIIQAAARPAQAPPTPKLSPQAQPTPTWLRQQAQQQAQPHPRQRRSGITVGGVLANLLALVVVLLLLLATVYAAFPQAVPLPGFIEEMLPSGQQQESEPSLSPSPWAVQEVSVELPSDTSDDAVIAALRQAYREQIEREYPSAIIREVSVHGASPTKAQLENGQTRYTARVQGRVYITQQ